MSFIHRTSAKRFTDVGCSARIGQFKPFIQPTGSKLYSSNVVNPKGKVNRCFKCQQPSQIT